MQESKKYNYLKQFESGNANSCGALAENIPQNPSRLEKIEKYINNICEFGLLPRNYGEKICQNLLNGTENGGKPSENADFIDFESLEGDDAVFLTERADLKNYFNEAGLSLTREEFSKIAELVKGLEAAAIERFKASVANSGQFKELKKLLKERLNSLSAKPFSGTFDVKKNFTPEEIGKMSTEEFLKNEAKINNQLASGQW